MIKFSTSTTVTQTLKQVVDFFSDPRNLAKWDKSVGSVVVHSECELREGFMFDTISPKGQRTAYVITRLDERQGSVVRVIDSPVFKYAAWTTKISEIASGTLVEIDVELSPFWQFAWMIAIIALVRRKAFAGDMRNLQVGLDLAYPSLRD